MLDVEWNGHSRTCPQKIDRELAREKIALMLTELEQLTGKKPVIYTDITFHREVLEGQFNNYPYWIRSTAALPETRYNNRPWAFWQFTTTGRVPGIKGDVDRNAFFGSESQFAGWLRGEYDIGAAGRPQSGFRAGAIGAAGRRARRTRPRQRSRRRLVAAGGGQPGRACRPRLSGARQLPRLTKAEIHCSTARQF